MCFESSRQKLVGRGRSVGRAQAKACLPHVLATPPTSIVLVESEEDDTIRDAGATRRRFNSIVETNGHERRCTPHARMKHAVGFFMCGTTAVPHQMPA